MDWAQLPVEVWAQIFADVHPYKGNPAGMCDDKKDHNMHKFYQLRAVSKRFGDVMTLNAHLCTNMSLTDKLESHHLPGLLSWIRKCGHAVTELTISCGSPLVGIALAALLSCQSILTSVTVTDIGEPSIHLLSDFKTLTTCQLQDPDEQPFSITALHALPHLVHLELQGGTFDDVDAAAHLTSLKLSQCEAFCSQSCPCVASLLQLSVSKDSCLADFHSQGVCACSVLQDLSCHNSFIGARDDRTECLDLRSEQQFLHIPSSLSALTALTCLALGHTDQDRSFRVGWLAELPKLRSVHLSFDILQLALPASLSALSSLTCLYVTNHSPHGSVLVTCDWTGFPMLQAITFRGPVLFRTVEGLVHLPALKCVSLRDQEHEEVQCGAVNIGLVAYALGCHRPDVQFCLD